MNRTIIFVFFLLFLLLLFLRDQSVGVDLRNYHYYFNRYSDSRFKEILTFIKSPDDVDVEAGYILLNWFVNCFTHDFRCFLIVVSLISIIPIAVLYYKNSEHAYLLITLFTTIGLFPMFFSGLRQIIAISIGVLAYNSAKDKKILQFALFVFLAALFHRTALILVLLYPCCHVRLRKKHLILIVPVLFVVFVFNKSIFMWIANLAPSIGIEIQETNAYLMLILYLLFAIWSFIIVDERNIDAEILGLRNILLVVCTIQMFAPLHTLAMRVNYYFLVYIPILISKVIDKAKPSLRQVAVLSNVVFCLLFTCYRIYSMYSGADMLQIYPYIPFWKG